MWALLLVFGLLEAFRHAGGTAVLPQNVNNETVHDVESFVKLSQGSVQNTSDADSNPSYNESNEDMRTDLGVNTLEESKNADNKKVEHSVDTDIGRDYKDTRAGETGVGDIVAKGSRRYSYRRRRPYGYRRRRPYGYRRRRPYGYRRRRPYGYRRRRPYGYRRRPYNSRRRPYSYRRRSYSIRRRRTQIVLFALPRNTTLGEYVASELQGNESQILFP